MRQIKIGGLYKHFKGDIYIVQDIAKDCDTLKEKVVYRNIKTDDVWVRDLEEFLSPVDKIKYPDCDIEYRFTEYKRK